MTVTPRGIVAALLVLVVAAVCIRLGFWQLDRLDQRRARNIQIEEALAAPVIPLDSEGLGSFEQDPLAFVNRRVRLRGRYDPEHEIVLRGRARGGRPGVHVVTPLRISGSDAAVLVNRGWAPSPDAATVTLAPLAEPGPREVKGLVHRFPAPGADAIPLSTEAVGTLSLQRLDLALLRAHLPYPILPVYIQQLPGSPRAEPPLRMPIPEPDEGPHLGYAIQWFSFATIAVIGFFLVVIRRGA